ncbi:transcriptional regulator, AsnC family [Thermosinus carboxydivorans Nor1]|uniref:Transcriptional regulator, AsnC family n=1 Tax=Thermosinus carboxydivorans Nor1 TaxID=401526 RepID=A1HTE7_9FIRM|nr:Lrp/AsnC family transcriptional regulator [Thermosinus carboxydivorans]EAX46696.1 transcriptional regulator, AsnC family [Thermosinus carboxydivorans Nor1]
MKELLELLEKDHRLTVEQLAAMLDRPVGEIAAALKDLEAKKVILKYHTFINWEKAGVDTVTALIDVRITPQREVGFDAIAERICRFPEVRSLYLMSGAYDLAVIVEGKNMKEVARFVATKLATMEGVVSTTTHFILKQYKEAGVILEDREEDRRLAVTP